MKKRFFPILLEIFGYLLLSICVFLMGRTIVRYSSFDPKEGFLAQKQAYLGIAVWRAAFYTHVFTSLFALLAGVSQFSSLVLSEHRSLHRWMRRLYVFDILFVNFPAGFIMAIYANAYLPSKIAFLILDSLWFWLTLRAFREARQRNFAAHKRFMIRSYSLTCSAVTLRLWKLILSSLFGIDPVTLYMIDAWLGFVPNLLFAEWFVRQGRARPERYLPKTPINEPVNRTAMKRT